MDIATLQGDLEAQGDRLRDLGVIALWLHGSRASDEHRPDSDLDLAVLYQAEVAPADRLARTLALESSLTQAYAWPDLDSIVVLNDAGLPLTHRVINLGTLVLSLDDEARVRWEAPKRSEAMDFMVFLAQERDTRLRALAGP